MTDVVGFQDLMLPTGAAGGTPAAGCPLSLPQHISLQRYHSPCGYLMLGSWADRLCLCDWEMEHHRAKIDTRLRRTLQMDYEEGTSAVIQAAIEQLDAYFASRLTAFDLPLLLVGTSFQQQVWRALLHIPYGSTLSYGKLARQLGCPRAVRAVANANGANALSVVIPCHRVIGSRHTLTGYGGGLAAKHYLLDLEAAHQGLWA